METMNGDYVLDKNDNWVEAPKDNSEECMDEKNEDDYGPLDDDMYQDTAGDCIGWEEDMIKNGEDFGWQFS
jgi:hypothetical protein